MSNNNQPPVWHVFIKSAEKIQEKRNDGTLHYHQDAYINTGKLDPITNNPAPIQFRIPLAVDEQPYQAGYYLFEHPLCLLQANQYGGLEVKRIYAGTPYPILCVQPLVASAVTLTAQQILEQKQKEAQEQKRIEEAKNAAGVNKQAA